MDGRSDLRTRWSGGGSSAEQPANIWLVSNSVCKILVPDGSVGLANLALGPSGFLQTHSFDFRGTFRIRGTDYGLQIRITDPGLHFDQFPCCGFQPEGKPLFLRHHLSVTPKEPCRICRDISRNHAWEEREVGWWGVGTLKTVHLTPVRWFWSVLFEGTCHLLDRWGSMSRWRRS